MMALQTQRVCRLFSEVSLAVEYAVDDTVDYTVDAANSAVLER